MFADAIVYYKIFDLTVAMFMKSSGSPEDMTFFSDANKKIREYELQHDGCVRIFSAPAIYFRPPYTSSDRTECIVENFTGQYRLDGLALGLARQRFSFTRQVHLAAYVYRNLSHHNSTAWQSRTDYLLRVYCQVRRNPVCQGINI